MSDKAGFATLHSNFGVRMKVFALPGELLLVLPLLT